MEECGPDPTAAEVVDPRALPSSFLTPFSVLVIFKGVKLQYKERRVSSDQFCSVCRCGLTSSILSRYEGARVIFLLVFIYP